MGRRRFHNIVIAMCLVFGIAAEARAQLRARVYASGFSLPVAFIQDPSNPAVQFVVEQYGRIRAVRSGTVLANDFLDLTSVVSTGGERGLLGLAFAPDYPTSGRFFVNFTNLDGNTVVARFRRSADPLVADPATRFDLHWGGPAGPGYISQPYANHNGGNLAFGPDGFLYIGMGDGGSGNDPEHRSQDPAERLGKMLRIDVAVPDSDSTGYRVPADNPFVGGVPVSAQPEIWSFGLRNPWRWSFDDVTRGGTGALVIGDVGQNAYEEIDYEPRNHAGRNYGWRNREGLHDNVTTLPPAYLPLTDPVFEYDHTVGQCIIGGYVYRGRALGTTYRGRYFFGDEVQGRIWSLALTIDSITGEATTSDLVEHTSDLGGRAQLGNISSFGVDSNGELYVLNYAAGTIIEILGSRAGGGDFDGDARIDMTLYRASTGQWSILRSSSEYMSSTVAYRGGVGYTPVPGDYDGDGKIDIAVYNTSTGMWSVLTSSSGYTSETAMRWGGSGYQAVPGDYDGDGKTDFAVYNTSTGVWSVLTSSSGYTSAISMGWGGIGYQAVPGDYDGDGKTDFAVYHTSTGTWSVLTSSSEYSSAISKGWGGTGYQAVPGDYDGDGKTDFAVYNTSTGHWSVLTSGSAFTTSLSAAWGGVGYTPVPGDYDGDGKADFGLYQKSSGNWYILESSSGYTTTLSVMWGGALDDAVTTAVATVGSDRSRAGDFDADGMSDLTVYNMSTGMWSVLTSSSGYTSELSKGLGGNGDQTVPGDYDGDGKTDIAVYNTSTGMWTVLTSSSEYTSELTMQLGGTGYQAVPGDYDGDGKTDFAVYNTSTGAWSVLTSSSGYTSVISKAWGGTGYQAVPGDYDGDGKTDFAVYNTSTGMWSVLTSSSGYTAVISKGWGGSGYQAVPGDYDGDGKIDFGVYVSSTGYWYVLTSSTSYTSTIIKAWGGAGFTPVPGDYDGDGRTDLAVYEESSGNWSVLTSSSNYRATISKSWGGTGFTAVPSYP